MRNLNNELKNKTINYDKILKYGFTKEAKKYIYNKKIFDNQFEMIVTIENEIVTAKLIDILNEEEYILVDIEGASGEFVGKVRKEYENNLQDIISKCTNSNIFKTEQAKEIIKFIKEKYNDDLEFLWEKFPEDAIWRNKKNNKWYGLIGIISENKIGIDSDKEIEILDLKYQKNKTFEIIDNKQIYPAYHMNKNSWITIKLDDKLDLNKIFELIENSYNLSIGKNKNC